LQGREHILGEKRLAKVIVSTFLDRLNRGVDRRVGRHHDRDDLGPPRAQVADQLNAVALAESNVDERNCNGVPLEDLDGRVRRVSGFDRIAFKAQKLREAVRKIPVVVDHQYVARRLRADARGGLFLHGVRPNQIDIAIN